MAHIVEQVRNLFHIQGNIKNGVYVLESKITKDT